MRVSVCACVYTHTHIICIYTCIYYICIYHMYIYILQIKSWGSCTCVCHSTRSTGGALDCRVRTRRARSFCLLLLLLLCREPLAALDADSPLDPCDNADRALALFVLLSTPPATGSTLLDSLDVEDCGEAADLSPLLARCSGMCLRENLKLDCCSDVLNQPIRCGSTSPSPCCGAWYRIIITGITMP